MNMLHMELIDLYTKSSHGVCGPGNSLSGNDTVIDTPLTHPGCHIFAVDDGNLMLVMIRDEQVKSVGAQINDGCAHGVKSTTVTRVGQSSRSH